MKTFEISGNIVDISNREIYPGTISVVDGKIQSIKRDNATYHNYLMPGFIDAHIHIESSMLVPSEFARIAVTHGTVATVSDPHEISNVLGIDGINFMLENSEKVPFKFYYGAPSCVPATTFETAGAFITKDEIAELFLNDKIKYLSEMMNFPGVIYDFPDVMDKIKVAKENKRPIDGHAPGLRGEQLTKYVSAGITTDHECFTLDEALEKISLGMKILIREGTAAKNFDILNPLIKSHPEMCMFCSDDKHPDDLVKGHINKIVKRAIGLGYNLMDVLRIAILNPIEHYKLDAGLLRIGDDADLIEIDNLKDFNVLKTFIKGGIVAENGITKINHVRNKPVNKFVAIPKISSDFQIEPAGNQIRVIEAIGGELITNEIIAQAKIHNNNIISDIENDILKIAVVNRYRDSKPAIAFIKNFGLIRGAIASSVAHDSHNIIAVGTSDNELCNAVNAIIETKGGMAVSDGNNIDILPLPVAGLMSDEDGYTVAKKYTNLGIRAKGLGSKLHSPFMTLSFMALLVIPKLKLSDKGLFDGEKFQFVNSFKD